MVCNSEKKCIQITKPINEESFTYLWPAYFWPEWTLKILGSPYTWWHDSPLPLTPCSSRHEMLLSLSFTTLQTTILFCGILSFHSRLWDTSNLEVQKYQHGVNLQLWQQSARKRWDTRQYLENCMKLIWQAGKLKTH